MGSNDGMAAVAKREKKNLYSCQERNPCRPARSQVTILTPLSRLCRPNIIVQLG